MPPNVAVPAGAMALSDAGWALATMNWHAASYE